MSDDTGVESVIARVKAVYGSWRRDTTFESNSPKASGWTTFELS